MPESPPSVEAVAAFVEKIHIFYDISEDDLFAISERLDDKRVKAGEVILDMDEPSNSLYIIYAGRVDKERKGKGQKNSRLLAGDYFGTDVFFDGKKRGAKLTAHEDTLLLELPRDHFEEIPEAIDFLRNQLKLFMPCRELLDKIHFDWIKENEAVYFAVNKHPILFWRRAPLPLLLLLGSPVTVLWGMWVGAIFPLILGVIGFVAGALWLLWDWLDWGNDYYVVTNQRVVWLEKIIGIFDSRKEANLEEVKSVDAQTDVIVQSFFDYGHVNVNTIFGGIKLRYIPYPRQAQLLIEELWERAKRKEDRRAKERLQKAIVEQIEAANLVEQKKRQKNTKPEAAKKEEATFLQKLFLRRREKSRASLFSLRYEEGKSIIYRKHFVVLIRRTLGAFIFAIILGGYIIYQFYLKLFVQNSNGLQASYLSILILGFLATSAWLIYQYVDWRNDIFKVSQDKIFDIDRKPFGDVQSRSSELKNIESTEYRRTGLLSILFNYGTVYIHIGSEEFEFEDVLDPAAVQQDINTRYHAIQEKEKLAQEKKERKDMIKWLVAYHESTDDIDAMIERIKQIKNRPTFEDNETEDAENQQDA